MKVRNGCWCGVVTRCLFACVGCLSYAAAVGTHTLHVSVLVFDVLTRVWIRFLLFWTLLVSYTKASMVFLVTLSAAVFGFAL